MGKHYVMLSFFKTKKIDYIFDSKNMVILFPCPHCWEQAKMNAISSEWQCKSCNQFGNLLSVLKVNDTDPIKAKIEKFDPKKERLQINHIFVKVFNNQLDSKLESDLVKLKVKLNDLLDHYEKLKVQQP
jgi:ribosomal protein L37AE/L43A